MFNLHVSPIPLLLLYHYYYATMSLPLCYRLYRDNEQLCDTLESRDKEHSGEIAQLLKQHQATMQKVHTMCTVYITME